mmetsp:Transcript_52171/g.82849  ORF Transcript_52171/g.82849 Transcript_52171/m.82849 type:complete len:217 (+) Transcript_52171:43-693(+)|eukprot:CAMPEP_0169104196 /NCGR_PEP_ID=MMETSP1015-20121227/23126_1 /TAXON_ID=342587 /ORGANISM="Karlodinium micrum, Strain CCMP2283" /LENGTH=216 /DNA_ID=CAMNT_0009165457 /DNA_START=26 /DNA_END=676 /DNA_ORIENTATION=-
MHSPDFITATWSDGVPETRDTRQGDGYQSPQSQYFDPPCDVEASPFCLPDAPEVEADQLDTYMLETACVASPCFAVAPSVVGILPCYSSECSWVAAPIELVPVLVQPFEWEAWNSIGTGLPPEYRRSAKRYGSKDGKHDKFARSKGDHRQNIAASMKAAGMMAAATKAKAHSKHPMQKELLQSQHGDKRLQASSKNTTNPYSVFIDLSCLRPSKSP